METILIVDDEKNYTLILSAVLEDEGFETVTANSGNDALNILGKMAYAPAVPLLWTMIADAADYAEWTSGRRATGLFFSAATFAQKGGWGIGGALAGWLLAAYGYVEKAAEQTALALTGIKMLISVFPGLLYISCAFILIFYALDEATCSRMKRELEERRGDEAATPA